MSNRYFALVFIVLFAFSSYNCNKKDTSKTTSQGDNSDLITNTDYGVKVNLKMKPKVGDKVNYKMVITQRASQISELTKNKEVSSNQEMSYYYSLNVGDINDAGTITYKVKYDSIKVSYSEKGVDSTFSIEYNSNIKNDNNKMEVFLTYNALIGNEFKVRVSPLGEVKEVIEMDKVESYIAKEYGDTLKSEEKSQISESLKTQLKEIIQSQFQIFSDKEVYKDSSWTITQQSAIGSFPIENIISYKLEDIQKQDNGTKINIAASLEFKVLENKIKEKDITMTLEDDNGKGSGNVIFNITKGLIEKKQYEKSLSSVIKMSAQGQSAKAKRNDSISYTVEILN